jgi:hypothetical protein
VEASAALYFYMADFLWGLFDSGKRPMIVPHLRRLEIDTFEASWRSKDPSIPKSELSNRTIEPIFEFVETRGYGADLEEGEVRGGTSRRLENVTWWYNIPPPPFSDTNEKRLKYFRGCGLSFEMRKVDWDDYRTVDRNL